jgi:prophage maintenance system killer protein
MGLASLISRQGGPGAGLIGAHSSSAGGAQHADAIQAHRVVAARAWPAGYFHTLFSLNTAQEVEQAAALGVNFTMCYGYASQASADLTTQMGQAMARNGMRTFLTMLDFLKAHNGAVTLDTAGAAALVTRYKDSPLLAGYWIKDDDIGDERATVMALRNLIRSLDPNPHHVIVAGFADANSVQQNYVHGLADALGFYPYPAFSRGPAVELPDMLRIVRARTPAGAVSPPFVGIYQAFGTPPARPVPSESDVVAQVQTFVANGAAAIAGFGWEVATESHAPSNDANLRQAIQTVGDWLKLNGARLHGIGV